MTTITQEYIELDDRGRARIIGTGFKVRMLAIYTIQGLSPQELHEYYPHLSMAQIHAALTYYYDHKSEMDAEIEEGNRFAEEMRQKNPNKYTKAEWLARFRAITGRDQEEYLPEDSM